MTSIARPPASPGRNLRQRRGLLVAALAMALAALMAGQASPAAARPLAPVRGSGVLVVATEGQFAPFNFFKGGQLSGFEVELANALAARMGLKVEWKAIGFDALLTGLAQDRWDLVIASHGITDERARAVAFAAPHYCSGAVVVARDPSIRGAADLAGKVVAVQTGTTYLASLRKLPGIKDIKNFPQDSDARAALASGRVDAWLTDRFVAMNALAANPADGLKLGELVFVERIAAAAARGNTGLVAAYNQALAAMLADGSYAAISKRWFDDDIRCR